MMVLYIMYHIKVINKQTFYQAHVDTIMVPSSTDLDASTCVTVSDGAITF